MPEPGHGKVTFRYAGLPTEYGELPGFCLGFPDKVEALEFSRRLHENLLSKQMRRPLRVFFEDEITNDNRFIMEISEPGEATVYRIDIEGIERSLVDKLKQGIAAAGYYFILAGYREGEEFELLPPREFHVFQKDVYINGVWIAGVNKAGVDWLVVFGNKFQ